MAHNSKRDWEDYDSNFGDDVNVDGNGVLREGSSQLSHKSSKRTNSLENSLRAGPSTAQHSSGLPSKLIVDDVARRTESYKNAFLSLNAYERHKRLVQDYWLYFPKATKLLCRDESKDKTDSDIIRENHRFLWTADNEADTWEKQLAKRYYDKLFKEYGICDLTHWNTNKVGVRWRTESELEKGKGHFTCGAKGCENDANLRTWEINFVYIEESQKKNALVKLRLCPTCSEKLNYRSQKKEVTKKSKKRKSRVSGASKSKKEKLEKLIEEKSGPPDDSSSAENAEKNIWKEPIALPEFKSREEEYEEYLDDLLL